MSLNRFRRTTRDGRWLPEIDGLRFIAIAGVVLFHMSGELQERSGTVLAIEPRYAWLFRMVGNGDRGVVLFFVISGFILALPFARQYLEGAQPVSVRKFYLRRLTRLEPPFLISTAICALILLIYTHGSPPSGFYAHLAATALYVHGLIYQSQSWINPVTWTLEMEVQFYVLVPLFVLLLKMRPATWRRGIMLVLLLACGLVQARYFTSIRALGSLSNFVQYFLAGILMADFYTLEFPKLKAGWWWDAVGCVCLLFTFYGRHESLMMHTVLPFVFLLLFVAAFKSRMLRRCLVNPWIAVCGGMCYSIYLLHFVLMAVFFRVTRHAVVFAHDFLGNFVIQVLVTVLPIVLLCAVFFLLVEKPCMDPAWPSKLRARLRGARVSGVDGK